MTPAEKAKQTREANKRRAAHRDAVSRYAARHSLIPRGVSFGVYADNQTCRDCGAVVHEVDLFRDDEVDLSRDDDFNYVRVCPACVEVPA